MPKHRHAAAVLQQQQAAVKALGAEMAMVNRKYREIGESRKQKQSYVHFSDMNYQDV